VLAMGTPGLEFIEQVPGYEAYVVGADLLGGRTSGFDPIWATDDRDNHELDSAPHLISPSRGEEA
jgi:hypothetical protein